MNQHHTTVVPCSGVGGRSVHPVILTGARRALATSQPDQAYARILAGRLESAEASRYAYVGSPAARPMAIEHLADASVDSIAPFVWTMNGCTWNRTQKFGPFGHFQRWRFAT